MWIVLAVLAVVVLMQVVGSSGGYKTVDTGQVVQAINKNKVESGQADHRRRADHQGRAQGRPEGRGQRRRSRRATSATRASTSPTRCRTSTRASRSPTATRSRRRKQNPFVGDAALAAALRPHRRRLPVPDESDAGRRLPGHELREVQGQADHQGHPEDDVRRRRGVGRGRRGAPRDQGVPAGAGQVPGRRRQDPQGCAALRPARYGQDAARARRRGRGGRPVLLDLRFRLRRDVRRCRCLPSP